MRSEEAGSVAGSALRKEDEPGHLFTLVLDRATARGCWPRRPYPSPLRQSRRGWPAAPWRRFLQALPGGRRPPRCAILGLGPHPISVGVDRWSGGPETALHKRWISRDLDLGSRGRSHVTSTAVSHVYSVSPLCPGAQPHLACPPRRYRCCRRRRCPLSHALHGCEQHVRL